MAALSEAQRDHLRGLPDGSLTRAEVRVLLNELEEAERKLARCQEFNRNLAARMGIASLYAPAVSTSEEA